MTIRIYLGESLLSRLEEKADDLPFQDLKAVLFRSPGAKERDWCDVAGLLAPKEDVQALVSGMERGDIASIEEVRENLTRMYEEYRQKEWSWCLSFLEERLQKTADRFTGKDLEDLILDYRVNAVKLNSLILKDAAKEFEGTVMTGFGVDGDETVRDADFHAVRGVFDENKFVTEVRSEMRDIEQRADRMISKLRHLSGQPVL